MMKRFRVVIPKVMVVVFSITITAQAQGDAQELVDVVQNRETPAAERVVALDKLRRSDRPTYLRMLSELISGDEEPFAVHAAEQLVKLIVMIGSHGASQMDADPDIPRHDMTFVNRVKELLRTHVASPNHDVRKIVVPYLMSQGDELALAEVRKGTKEGILTDEEALGYYIAAPPDIGGEELRRYAENGKDSLAKRAIDVLATDTSQQSYLRERILANTELTESRRVAALVGLAKYDDSFATYVIQLAMINLDLQVGQEPAELITQRLQQDLKENPVRREGAAWRFTSGEVEGGGGAASSFPPSGSAAENGEKKL